MSQIICTSVVLNEDTPLKGKDQKKGFLVVEKKDGFNLVCKPYIISVSQQVSTAAFDVTVLKNADVINVVDAGKTPYLQMTRSYGDNGDLTINLKSVKKQGKSKSNTCWTKMENMKSKGLKGISRPEKEKSSKAKKATEKAKVFTELAVRLKLNDLVTIDTSLGKGNFVQNASNASYYCDAKSKIIIRLDTEASKEYAGAQVLTVLNNGMIVLTISGDFDFKDETTSNGTTKRIFVNN